ncbi:hypothetical protein LJR231_005355 [Phyllobacterium sp. LjRoot231]|uniref:hypothetical protein n=1 Tax=Phyllobacterium sp. LjRoot231 TaxID=3342289 RepID=UPI003ECFECEE
MSTKLAEPRVSARWLARTIHVYADPEGIWRVFARLTTFATSRRDSSKRQNWRSGRTRHLTRRKYDVTQNPNQHFGSRRNDRREPVRLGSGRFKRITGADSRPNQYLPIQSISYEFGSKSMSGYFDSTF